MLSMVLSSCNDLSTKLHQSLEFAAVGYGPRELRQLRA